MPRSSKPLPAPESGEYGRGTGVPHPVDDHAGGRLRLRRLLFGMNQEALATALGLTSQQVQKYEKGTNRLSASRLAAAAKALGVPISYFFEGLRASGADLDIPGLSWRELQHRPETIDLIRHFYAIADARLREQFLLMVKAVALTDPAADGR